MFARAHTALTEGRVSCGSPDVAELQLPPSLATGHASWGWWELMGHTYKPELTQCQYPNWTSVSGVPDGLAQPCIYLESAWALNKTFLLVRYETRVLSPHPLQPWHSGSRNGYGNSTTFQPALPILEMIRWQAASFYQPQILLLLQYCSCSWVQCCLWFCKNKKQK